jgi:hypothetical protein
MRDALRDERKNMRCVRNDRGRAGVSGALVLLRVTTAACGATLR